MFQAYSTIFTTLDILRYICPQILADSGTFRILAKLDIFMFMKAYLETMVHSGTFRTIYISSQFQARYSAITKEQFMLILNLI